MYTVYQVPTDHYFDTETGQLTGGFNPMREIRNGDKDEQALVKKNLAAYQAVANFYVDDLDAVFEASNCPHTREHFEGLTFRLRDMHSVSVGDLVKAPDGDFWLCASLGWAKL